MGSDRDRIEGLEADAVRRDERIEGLATDALLRDERIAELAAEVDGLEKVIEHRAVIEQAKGVIMHSLGCGPDAAFAVLVAQSQIQNRKLWEVATELAGLQDRD
jgi:AmiR/NasT family two-component response regulator